MSEFLRMGGYAAFVWPAYVISVAGLATMVAVTLKSYFRAVKRSDASRYR